MSELKRRYFLLIYERSTTEKWHRSKKYMQSQHQVPFTWKIATKYSFSIRYSQKVFTDYLSRCNFNRIVQNVLSLALKGVVAEHFCCASTLPLLIKLEKLIKISVLISVEVWPRQRSLMYEKSKAWMGQITFSMTLGYSAPEWPLRGLKHK